MKFLLLFVLFYIGRTQASSCRIRTVRKLDLNKYSGRWFDVRVQASPCHVPMRFLILVRLSDLIMCFPDSAAETVIKSPARRSFKHLTLLFYQLEEVHPSTEISDEVCFLVSYVTSIYSSNTIPPVYQPVKHFLLPVSIFVSHLNLLSLDVQLIDSKTNLSEGFLLHHCNL